MRIRLLLLAGTILPFALNAPALASEPSAKPLVLAQADAPACPEGQECPPACPEGQECPPPAQPEQPPPAEAQPPAETPPPAEEPPPAEAPPAEQPPAEAPPAEQAPAEQPAPEQPAAEQPAPEQPAPQEQQAPAEQPPATQEQPAQPPAGEQPEAVPPAPDQADQAQPQQNTGERPRRRQQQQDNAGEQQPPAPDQQAVQPPAEQQPAAEQPSVVEQQLEAQGDTEEAKRVRSLREQLLNQLQEAIAPAPEQQQQQGSRDRRDRRDRGGVWNREPDQGQVVEERSGRIIIDLGGGNIHVEQNVPDEGGRLLYGADDVEVQDLPHGRTRTIVHRPNGVDIVTERDRQGNIIKRSKYLPDGREIVLIDNRYEDNDSYRAPPPVLNDVPPPRVRIPRDRYIVDLGRASDDDIRYALQAPPVQTPPRPYTLDEVLRNEQVRAYSPRIDLDTITFDFGSATIGNDQMASLFHLGQAMEDVIAEHPDEVYLIEGHTDAVGSDYDNLILSDQRAEAVATALSQNFDIPPENLVTEGYGEQFLKVNTLGPERQNRRAAVRRVTDLLQAQSQ